MATLLEEEGNEPSYYAILHVARDASQVRWVCSRGRFRVVQQGLATLSLLERHSKHFWLPGLLRLCMRLLHR